MPRQFSFRKLLRGPQEPVSDLPTPEPEETPGKGSTDRAWVLEEELTPEEFARLTAEQKRAMLRVRLYARIRCLREAVDRDETSAVSRWWMYRVIDTYSEIEAMGPHDVFH